ncbi:MAG: cation:proton antiporter [Spirochaetes bacterium]|nr:cation:proton antiporter [Spirochaetota bacterium]
MEHLFFLTSIWLALALISAVLAYYLKVSIALVEICVGMVMGAIATAGGWFEALGTGNETLRFLASSGAVLLTFLAGAELEHETLKKKVTEVSIVGFIGFLAPFVGCSLVARFLLGWDVQASLLAGIALSTTSMAVVYAVMLETGFNSTEFGKGILGACFINDIGTVVALSLIFAPFSYKTFVFLGITILVLFLLPVTSRFITHHYSGKTAAIRTKWMLFVLFALSALALWSGSEAVLPAYLAGIVLAEFARVNHTWLRRLRTLTVGFLTPLYFLRAGTLVSLPALLGGFLLFFGLFLGKVASKIFGLYPVIARFRRDGKERWYYSLMMSTGLTFGTIAALYGLTHRIVTQAQYSLLVGAVIASAVIPTLIANAAFLPVHLLPAQPSSARTASHEAGAHVTSVPGMRTHPVKHKGNGKGLDEEG